ncbi:N-acylneuraminate cytidylyltransferase [Methanococcoides vulcani]|uniref:N-acylneuraminate cytidylyltransferase n=1 Tax=Methanococcoides vulcani TaxID=1353158 RepID=A0A1I0ANW1_9EURY|nr:acylneuraminate cytidylyltransferase family protein [Methanococcoides vulcani]SES96042.1 N-acylneuraminate cytidylyltransferase [Methanococcoides vulcani]
MKPKTIAIIPARGGSKGIPRKNVRLLAEKPLIAHSIEAALNSKYVEQVLVSTEDQEIVDVSREYGADIIKRPEELAQDSSPTIDTIFHVINSLEIQNNSVDVVALLQPTSPLRTADDIDDAIELFLKSECESLISVCEAGHPPFWHSKIEEGYLKPIFDEKYLNMRRQDLPKTYLPNGAIYLSTPKNLKKYRSFYCPKTIPYIMPIQRSIDIDTEIDFITAEILLKSNDLYIDE